MKTPYQKRRAKAKTKQTRLSLQMVNDQPCGECQACCNAIAVHELDKPQYTNCQHQCASGCGIYEQRPQSCRTYYCLWQAGFMQGDLSLRPDRLGVILDFRVEKIGDSISVWEVREGAADDPVVKAFLTRVAEKFIIIIRRYNSRKRRIMGTGVMLSKLERIVEIQ